MATQQFMERRKHVQGAVAPGVMVLPCAPHPLRNNDVHHGYRQDSDLFYLTGFEEPECVLVLSSAEKPQATLFLRPRDPEREVWDGARAGIEGAVKDFGVDQAYPIGELDRRLPDLLAGHERLYYHIGRYQEFDSQLIRALSTVRARARRGITFPTEIVDADRVVHELRRIKTHGEVQSMLRAAEITAKAHRAAMAAAHPGAYEYELEAVLRGVFTRFGSARVAYEPIVGSGPNATVLHHVLNNRQMHEGELVLIDAGCEYEYYAADVTRTFPVSGVFSPAQRDLYQLVLTAQERAIALSKSGNTVDAIHEQTVRDLSQGMIDVGLLQGPLSEVLEKKSFQRYYMHRTSHYLGMDVHDVGSYYQGGKFRALEPGVVITIEPGLYVNQSDEAAPAHFRGIGIRIEDDVLVTGAEPVVLSQAVPKSIADVEQACGDKSALAALTSAHE